MLVFHLDQSFAACWVDCIIIVNPGVGVARERPPSASLFLAYFIYNLLHVIQELFIASENRE